MQLHKTFTQPIGSPLSATISGDELALDHYCGIYAGDFLSLTIGGCCIVDRVKSIGSDGLIKLTGSGYEVACVAIQRLANLSGFWLQVDITPPPPISLGIACSGPEGLLLDRAFPECALGRTLTINGQSLGTVLGAVVLADGRSVVSVSSPKKLSGVAVASAEAPRVIKGAISGASPFLTLNATLPTSGEAILSLRQGWRSSKDCIPDVINFCKPLCRSALGV
jgi:hypothetical protein